MHKVLARIQVGGQVKKLQSGHAARHQVHNCQLRGLSGPATVPTGAGRRQHHRPTVWRHRQLWLQCYKQLQGCGQEMSRQARVQHTCGRQNFWRRPVPQVEANQPSAAIYIHVCIPKAEAFAAAQASDPSQSVAATTKQAVASAYAASAQSASAQQAATAQPPTTCQRTAAKPAASTEPSTLAQPATPSH